MQRQTGNGRTGLFNVEHWWIAVFVVVVLLSPLILMLCMDIEALFEKLTKR